MRKPAKLNTSRCRMEALPENTTTIFASVVEAFAADTDVAHGGGKGFGSAALKVNDKIFAMVSSKGHFVVKLPRERVEELVARGIVDYLNPGRGKLMKEWVALDGSNSLWITLALEARRFVAEEIGIK